MCYVSRVVRGVPGGTWTGAHAGGGLAVKTTFGTFETTNIEFRIIVYGRLQLRPGWAAKRPGTNNNNIKFIVQTDT